MRKLKFLGFISLLFSVFSLASCSSEDDVVKQLTSKQKEAYAQNISGEYPGQYIITYKNKDCVEILNKTLSEYGKYIIGRMGVPYHKKEVNIISIAIDAPQDVINTLSGTIGRLDGVYAKTAYSDF